MQILKTTKYCVLAAMAAMLTACAHPDLIKPGTSENVVISELGAPDSKMTLPDGGSILVYSMQPFGKEVYWMRFDKDGQFLVKEKAMNEDHFKLVIPGKHTKADVYQMFGHCAQEYEFRLQDQTAFMYRFDDVANMPMAFWVQFDLKGVVTETAVTQDPWDRDNDWLIGL